MTVVYGICLGLVCLAALITAAFVVRTRGLADRAIGLDTLTAVIINGLAVTVAATTGRVGIELLLLFSLLGFLGTVSVARFIERRGPTLEPEAAAEAPADGHDGAGGTR
jgi:multicomponent Na+:H+ antiporter subunit F